MPNISSLLVGLVSEDIYPPPYMASIFLLNVLLFFAVLVFGQLQVTLCFIVS